MHDDLWDFALRLYARPGVEKACLNLQVGGGNVCLLLCAVWMGSRKVAVNDERALRLRTVAEPWHAQVIEPLRAVRQNWRAQAHDDRPLEALREQVKGLELQAEKLLLERLQAVAADWPADGSEAVSQWLEATSPAKPDREALRVLRDAVREA